MNILLFSKQINNNIALKTKCSQQGFLLLELMVSILLIIFFAQLLHTYCAMTHNLSHDAISRFKALMLLESFIVDVKNNPLLLKQKNYKKDGYTITWAQQPFPIQKTGFLTTLKSTCKYYIFEAAWLGTHKKNNTITMATGVIIS